MQVSPTQSIYGARPPQPARAAVPPSASAPQPGASGIISTTTKDGVKAAYSPESMSYKLTDTNARTTLIAYGSDAAALYDGKRGIAAAVSPSRDVIVQSGNQSVALGNLADPATAQKLRSFLTPAECGDLLIDARTHDLARTSLGRRVVQGAPDWLKSVRDRQMMDPRVLALPPVQRLIRAKAQPADAARSGADDADVSPDPNTAIPELQQKIADDKTAIAQTDAMSHAIAGDAPKDGAGSSDDGN